MTDAGAEIPKDTVADISKDTADIPNTVAPAEGEDPAQPSKKAAKKAEAKAKKEAEKARKAAEREATQAATGNGGAAGEDTAKENYGSITIDHAPTTAPKAHLREIERVELGQTVTLRAWIQNARMQGAKMAFVELREEGNWTVQGVVAASADGKVSRQMVKWVGGLKLESFVVVVAKLMKPLEPVKSTRVANFELHIERCYLVASAPEMLGLGLAAASRAVGKLDEEEDLSDAAAGRCQSRVAVMLD